MRAVIALLVAAVLAAAELPLSGTWVGTAPQLTSDSTVVLAMYNRKGACCGGPAAVLAGLVNLQTAFKERADVRFVAIDVTDDATVETATVAARLHFIEGLPLLVDAGRTTAASLGVGLDMTMTYVIAKADGTRTVAHSPGQVRRALKR